MRFTEERKEPRYAFSAGFIEINDQPLPLDDLSANGLGFHSESEVTFQVGDVIEGFLVLQSVDDQFEMPVKLTVRRIVDKRIGCSMTCPIPHHAETINEFIGTLDDKEK